LTIIDQEEFSRVADLLKKQWKELGIEVEVKKVNLPSHEFEQEIIKPRDYESILFGKVIGLIPDLFSFWHSSQKKEPGLNLALYENKEADKLLEEARQTLNEEERKGKYEEFQDILIDDAPVVFLYSPTYLYLVSKDIKGIKEGLIANSSKRFIDIENWYIKIKRVWK
jgi:peptide/nickel transport system substrate-binding protein